MPAAISNRQKLIDTAVDLFSLNGYDGVSIRDLCRAVGIKESSFYNHFHGKDELLRQILEGFRTRQHLPAEEMLDTLRDLGEPADFFTASLRRFEQQMADAETRKIQRIINLEQYRSPLAREILFEEVIQRPQHFAELVFERWMDKGIIPRRDSRQLALEYQLPIHALMLQLLVLDAAGLDTAPVLRQVADHVRFFSAELTA